jgi:hypothetical protein
MSKPKSLRKSYRTRLEEGFPETMRLVIGDEEIEYTKSMSLRYGENPHQPAAFYSPKQDPLTTGAMEILKTGKGGLSQTNLEDVNNSMNIVRYFEEPPLSGASWASTQASTRGQRRRSSRATSKEWWPPHTMRRRSRCSRERKTSESSKSRTSER